MRRFAPFSINWLNKVLVLVLGAVLICTACRHRVHRQVTPAVYYWKTTFNIAGQEQQKLLQQSVHKLYLRFFDVDFNRQSKVALPVADITISSAIDTAFEIVPVVFIRNRVFENTDSDSITGLASHIFNRVDTICARYHLKQFTEMQLDCDWTRSTAPKYFKLLQQLADKYHQRHIIISSTIRLHQVKYAKITGVPPVDRGMLMFYNMGNPEKGSSANSIYDNDIAKAYLDNFESYSLPLDVALPLFKWAIIYRNNKPVDIIDNTDSLGFEKIPGITKVETNVYTTQTSLYFGAHQLHAGDIIKVEQVDENTCLEAAQQVAPYIKTGNNSIAIFDFKPNDFFTHDTNTIKKVFNTFR